MEAPPDPWLVSVGAAPEIGKSTRSVLGESAVVAIPAGEQDVISFWVPLGATSEAEVGNC